MFRVGDKVRPRADSPLNGNAVKGEVYTVVKVDSSGGVQYVDLNRQLLFNDGGDSTSWGWRGDRFEVVEAAFSTKTTDQAEFVKARDELLDKLEAKGTELLGDGIDRLATWLDKFAPKA